MIIGISGEKCISWSSLCNFLYPSVTSSLFGPNIFLSTLTSNTHSVYSSPNATRLVSHPHEETAKRTRNNKNSNQFSRVSQTFPSSRYTNCTADVIRLPTVQRRQLTCLLILEESETEDMAFCCTAAELGVVHERLNPSS